MTRASVVNGFVTANEGGFSFSVVLADGGLLTQFLGMDFDPGESFHFIFGQYTPT